MRYIGIFLGFAIGTPLVMAIGTLPVVAFLTYVNPSEEWRIAWMMGAQVVWLAFLIALIVFVKETFL